MPPMLVPLTFLLMEPSARMRSPSTTNPALGGSQFSIQFAPFQSA